MNDEIWMLIRLKHPRVTRDNDVDRYVDLLPMEVIDAVSQNFPGDKDFKLMKISLALTLGLRFVMNREHMDNIINRIEEELYKYYSK